jgi:hypothetical protein
MVLLDTSAPEVGLGWWRFDARFATMDRSNTWIRMYRSLEELDQETGAPWI